MIPSEYDECITFLSLHSILGVSNIANRRGEIFERLLSNILLRFLVKQNVLELELPVSPSSAKLFRNIGGFQAKKCFIDHQTANTIQFFVAIKTNFYGLYL